MSERTEEPTEHRMREARAKGQVAQTQELTTLLQLSAALGFFLSQGTALLQGIQALILSALEAIPYTTDQISECLFSEMIQLFLSYVLPFGAVIVAGTLAAHFSQVGMLFALGALSPKLDKFNPVQNLQNLFSVKHLIEIGKSLIKLALVGFIFYYLLKEYVMSFQFLPVRGLEAAMPLAVQLIYWLWLSLIGCYLIFALGDYSFQRHLLMKNLRMTKEEVKQEYKNNEGNPEIKSRRKEMHQEIQSGSLASQVKKSSVIVRNPIHIAVGLYYRLGETPLPMITEMGRGERARRIVEIAQEAGIPVVENVALARKLIRVGERQKPIPVELMEPVAETLRILMEYQQAEGVMEPPPE